MSEQNELSAVFLISIKTSFVNADQFWKTGVNNAL